VTEAVDCVVETTDALGFSQVRSALLKLRGPLRGMEVFRDYGGLMVSRKRRPPALPMYLEIEGMDIPSRSITWHVSWDEEDLAKPKGEDPTRTKQAHALFVTPVLQVQSRASRDRKQFRQYGLILERCEEARERYQRVGVLTLINWKSDNPYYGVLSGYGAFF
jgi:hypothetical protein